jgi:hypothetical protein
MGTPTARWHCGRRRPRHRSGRVCAVIVVPQVRHSNVRVIGPLSCSKMLGITRARCISFLHFGQAGCSVVPVIIMARQTLQHPRDLRRVPMRAARWRRNAALVECVVPLRLVMPAACNSFRMGARSAALALARAVRALSALLGARWPKWRPVGIGKVCHRRVNSSATLFPRDAGLARVKVNSAFAPAIGRPFRPPHSQTLRGSPTCASERRHGSGERMGGLAAGINEKRRRTSRPTPLLPRSPNRTGGA